MKARTNLFRRSLQFHIALMCLIYLPCLAFGIQPIATIGQPLPQQHAFLSNETILRVVPTHIQVVNPYTNEVIDEFGERRNDFRNVSDVEFGPNAEHLVILHYSSDSRITSVNIWDVNAREQVSEWEIPARIEVATFSPTETLLTTSFDDEIHLWNWQTGALIGTLIGERRPSERCHSNNNSGTTCSSFPRDRASVFSPDGRYLFVASNRPDVELWNVETRRLEGHFEGHTGNWVNDVVISPDGRRLATYEKGWNDVYVWDTQTQQLLWKEQSSSGRIADIVFSPDSQYLYVASQTGELNWSGQGPWKGWGDQVSVWGVESGKQIDTFGDDFYILDAIALSPDGKTLLLHYEDAVVIWDIQSKQSLNVWADFVYSWDEALSPDGQTFVSVSRYFIKTWDVASQKMCLFTSAERSFFREFAISMDGKKIAIGQDPWVEVRNLRTGAIEHQFQHNYGDDDIAFSSTGRWVATRGYKKIHFLDLENPEKGQVLASEPGSDINYSSKFSFSENDEYFAASTPSENNDSLHWILLYKRHKETFIFQYAWQVPELTYASRPAFAKGINGTFLLALSGDHETQIFKLLPDRPELLSTFDVGAPVRFTSDSRYLFASQDGSLKIFDWQTQTPIEHPPIANYLDVSRDGSVANGGQIHIWDAKALLPSQPVAVDPQGKQIVTLGAVKQNQLLQNFPNPFNPETWIPFRVAKESNVTIHIYAPTGQLIRHLPLGRTPAGDYSSQSTAIYWDGRNQIGEPVSSGVYFYTITAGNFSATRKMLIRK